MWLPEPEPVAEAEHKLVVEEPAYQEPEVENNTPEYVAEPEPEPVIEAEPEPVIEEPEPVIEEPKPEPVVEAEPEPIIEEPEPVIEEPKPEPVVKAPVQDSPSAVDEAIENKEGKSYSFVDKVRELAQEESFLCVQCGAHYTEIFNGQGDCTFHVQSEVWTVRYENHRFLSFLKFPRSSELSQFSPTRTFSSFVTFILQL